MGEAMTDPTGKSFLSYRRSRAQEAALLIAAQHLHGIPTWQDIGDLDTGPTEAQVRAVLADPATANAILWITQDVAGSAFIQKVEAPLVLSRSEADDSFFVVPVAAGGLDFAGAATALGPQAAFHHLQSWNLVLADTDPIDCTFAAKLAFKILRRRLHEIHRRLPPDQPLKLRLSTRDPELYSPGTALVLNWHAHFTNREAASAVWEQRLYPALQNIGTAICQEVPGRSFEASGKLSLVAALVLGVVFLAPRNLRISWRQALPGQPDQLWSLHSNRTPSQLKATTTHHDVNSTALAVLVAVARRRSEVRDDFTASQASLPAFRAVLDLAKLDGTRYDLANPAEALDAAHAVADEIIKAKSNLGGIRAIHLFLAVPAGLAMLIGQLLNGLPEVQLYEHVPGASPGPYRPALKLNPSV
jgi:hypothetical protein